MGWRRILKQILSRSLCPALARKNIARLMPTKMGMQAGQCGSGGSNEACFGAYFVFGVRVIGA